ncbi:predicted protein [Histoplasma capsulatum G186AR]|uniref:Uncharacterized protein n=1 Tax=Ajellomyces capsulatus (strain G186AR / H82 / ATCC MYA-2454 / RMSCC 2432) TaxID=447093 RepID=C0NNP3_AJECG|nr:uncharacterized protein HCBG_04773 [Histoplasma capsulatum G186AR]EEH06553.1 predicted protein [Histoplasma capsulatum G186AR]
MPALNHGTGLQPISAPTFEVESSEWRWVEAHGQMVLGWLRNRTDCLESQQAQRSERWTEREGIKTAKVRSDQIGNRRRGSLKAVEGGGGWVGGRVARRRGRRETLEEKVWLAPISAELVGAPQATSGFKMSGDTLEAPAQAALDVETQLRLTATSLAETDPQMEGR